MTIPKVNCAKYVEITYCKLHFGIVPRCQTHSRPERIIGKLEFKSFQDLDLHQPTGFSKCYHFISALTLNDAISASLVFTSQVASWGSIRMRGFSSWIYIIFVRFFQFAHCQRATREKDYLSSNDKISNYWSPERLQRKENPNNSWNWECNYTVTGAWMAQKDR